MSKAGALGRKFARFKCPRCTKRFRSKKALNTHIHDKGHRTFRSLEDSRFVGIVNPVLRGL